MVLLALVTLALTVTFVVTLVRSTLTPKGGLIAYMTVALAPLLLLWLFVWNGYRHWNWWPFEYGSVLPHVLAGLMSLALLVLALGRVTGSLVAKVLIGFLACGLWLVLWLCGTVAVACGMGDCL